MSIQKRIRTCVLIEQMERQKEYSKKLGLENQSTFHGVRINDTNGNMEDREECLQLSFALHC